MNINRLAAKLGEERQGQFMRSAVWTEAAHRGMTWQVAAKDKLAVREAATRLSADAAAVLAWMLRLFAATPVEGDKLLKEIRRNAALSGAECQVALAELEEAGILFAVRKVWGESLYFIPPDTFAPWQQAMIPFRPEPLAPREREKLMNGEMEPNCRPLGRQLLSAFAALAACGLGLTSKGTLNKKTISKLTESAELDDRQLLPFGLNWPHREHYPLKAAFILEAASAEGLLMTTADSLRWNVPAFGRWLELNEEERERRLLDWCLSMLLPACGSGAHAAAAIIGLKAGEWYAEREVSRFLGSSGIAAFAAEDAERDSAGLWCALFHALGWLERVESRSGGERQFFFKWVIDTDMDGAKSIVEEQAAPFRRWINVQPSGELIAEPECPFTARWELELLAERVSDERVTVYRLTASSIARALENGRTRQSIRRFLHDASGGEGIPREVEEMVADWTSRACRTSFAEAVLLRCDNEQMAAIVESHPVIAPLLLEKLGPAAFIVDPAHVGEIRRLLQQAGYPPRKGMQAADAADEARPYPDMVMFGDPAPGPEREVGKCLTDSPFAYVYETFPLHHFELAANAARERLLASAANRGSIPAMWTKQLREYHSSTRKELIEQALQWQTPVQLRMKQGLRSFVPERLEQKDGGWAVIGLLRDEPERQPIRLTPDMWEEMRLVIPGRSDPI
ncbi:helicase-associated domain-containing protein [Paenibacillus arenilitoris]|uniref:Helicase-associated domain-containing protein n=1 Tax=Paenibacillus arenilitoris TaxID=2772299 RepID=A0A927CQ54_9BACL|nr:helicase-associated domain-containing protein [Paenibacillus arenilitoris]MBD2871470.1 helicase-associated domain-containing protein [Paenibacillus arenilitoris]